MNRDSPDTVINAKGKFEHLICSLNQHFVVRIMREGQNNGNNFDFRQLVKYYTWIVLGL